MCLSDLNGCELVALASVLSIVLSEELNADDTGILGDFFSSLGQNLSMIASTKNE